MDEELLNRRVALAKQAQDFMNTELYKELVKRIGEDIDELNQRYWQSWKDMDTEKKVSYLTGKREGVIIATTILNNIFAQGQSAVQELEQLRKLVTNAHY